MKFVLKIILFVLLLIAFLIIILIFAYPRFGQAPKEVDFKRFEKSSNFKDGKFINKIQNPILINYDKSSRKKNIIPFLHMMLDIDNLKPQNELPFVKSDILKLDEKDNLLIWLGHSSYYLQFNTNKILIDPIFSSYASPVPFINTAFKGNYPFSAKDFKELDLVLISHDHYDHLDYNTIKALKDKVKLFIVPLGVGNHLKYWGIKNYLEFDWDEDITLQDGLKIYILQAQHFSGRLKRNSTLWASFMIEQNGFRIYYSGDSGYSPHFKKIGQRFKNVDLAILENGQYNKRWPFSHMFPEESSQAGDDLNASKVLMAHSGRFKMSEHKWNEPYDSFIKASQDKNYEVLTPKMGQIYYYQDNNQSFNYWWKDENNED